MKQILRAESQLESPFLDTLCSTGLWAFAWKYARDTLMCTIEKRYFTVRCDRYNCFHASNGGVPAYWSGRSSLLTSLAQSRDLICIGSPSNALSVSTHFVSTGVIPYFATASLSLSFSYTLRSRRYFNSNCLERPFMIDLHNFSSL